MPTTLNWAGPSTLAAARPGDTVLVPAGIHDTPPFNISTSHLTLQIDGVLRSSAARRDWPLLPPLPTYGRDRDGAKARRHQALILLHNAHHVTIRGSGSIDGGGPWWWNHRHEHSAGRPHLIEVHSCSHIEISGLRLLDSPFWTVHLYNSTHLHLHDLTIRASARDPPPQTKKKKRVYEGMAPLWSPNTDGINPDSSRHVLIENNDVSVGDDHVAIKSGMNGVARGGGYSTENVTVRHNTFRLGMGVSIGSETAGGIRHVRVHDNTFLGGSWCVALHVKSAAQRGGVIEDVAFTHNNVRNTTALMRLATFGESIVPSGYAPTTVRNLLWAHNSFREGGGKRRTLRSKFLCPSAGRCSAIRVFNNTLPQQAKWQCVDVQLDQGHGEPPPRELVRGGCTAATKAEKKRRSRRRRRSRRNGA